MKFESYRVLFFSLLVASVLILLFLIGWYCFAPTNTARTAIKVLNGFSFLAMGSALLVNVACGIQHRKMWGRGGLWVFQKKQRVLHLINLLIFFAGGIFFLGVAVKFWLLPT